MNSITREARASVGYESLLVPGGFDCHLQTGESMEEDPVSRDPPHVKLEAARIASITSHQLESS